jgi:hypothetical protein
MEKVETHKQKAAIVGSNREVIIVALELPENANEPPRVPQFCRVQR